MECLNQRLSPCVCPCVVCGSVCVETGAASLPFREIPELQCCVKGRVTADIT